MSTSIRIILGLAALAGLLAIKSARSDGISNNWVGDSSQNGIGGRTVVSAPLTNLRITNTGDFRVTNTGDNRAVAP